MMKLSALLNSKSKSERQLGHIEQSEMRRGKSAKDAKSIAVATQRSMSKRLGVK